MQIRNAKKTESAPKAAKSKHLVAGLISGAVIGIFLASFTLDKTEPCTEIGEKCYKLEVARGTDDKSRGLSDRGELAEDRGMLFLFDRGTKPCMWMKNMRFSIDIIWLDESGKVEEIKESVSPDTFPASFCPKRAAKYVVELKAGQVRASGLSVTDRVMVN